MNSFSTCKTSECSCVCQTPLDCVHFSRFAGMFSGYCSTAMLHVVYLPPFFAVGVVACSTRLQNNKQGNDFFHSEAFFTFLILKHNLEVLTPV